MKRKFSLFVTIVVCLLIAAGILSACNEGEKKIASIDFADGEWQTNYYLGEVFEPCVATVTYEDGSTETVAVTPEMVKGFDTSKLGNYNIEITINGVTKVMTITVVEKGEEAHVHSMELTAAKEATCTEGGNNAYYHCSGCNKYFKDEAGTQETTVEAETISAAGHKWNNGEVTTAATCTEDGVMTYTCLNCSETKTETIAAAGHNYEETVISSTCTEEGYTLYECRNCDDSYTDNEVAALGHYMTLMEAKDATCTKEGNNAYYHCSRCDKYFKDIEGEEETTVEAETIAAKGHDYEETVVSPSCTEEGYTLYECRSCDDTYTDNEEAALGHYMTLTETKDATCTEGGNNAYYHCSRCDKYFKDIEGEEETTVEAETIPATGHNWNNGEITTAATCTTDGVKTYTCLDCAETKIETIPALGHGMTIIEAKDATCTEAGNNAYYHCSRCDKYFKDIEGEEETTVEAEVISATGHNWNDGEITTAATCTTDGIMTYTCLNCDEMRTETIPATGHDYEETVIAPTCTEEGYTLYECSACGDSYIDNEVTALGHSMTLTEANAATCTEAGNNAYYYCYRCYKYFKDIDGEEETTVEAETIPAAGHDYEETVIAPTCTEEGYTLYECRNCDDSYTDNKVAALGHSMTLTEAKDATCTEAGNNAYYHCSRCDKYFKDIEGEEETTVEAETIPARHKIVDGKCTICGKLYTVGLEYRLSSDETYYIVNGIGTASGDIVIPDTHEELLVKEIGDHAFEDCSNLTSIEIPAGVTSIGSSAFSGCSNLANVTFAEGSQLTSIGSSAFSGCSSLTSIELPEGVTSIRWYTFNGCSNLDTVYYAGSVKDWFNIEFFDEDSNPLYYGAELYIDGALVTEVVVPESVTTIDRYQFNGYTSLTSITIHSGVTSIGEDAFNGCSNLESVTFAEGSLLTSIGGSAFSGCSKLESVTFAEGSQLTSIGEYAFFYCSSLTSIEIPAGVTFIGRSAFRNCSSLKSIEIHAEVTSVRSWAFDCSNLNTVYYAGSIENWFNIDFEDSLSNPLNNGAELYIGGELVTEVAVPESVTTIGDYQFYGYDSLTSITIHSGVTGIGSYAFYGCSNLESVTFAEGSQLTSIGSYAFYGCSSLKSIEIPAGVTSIGDYAFRYCSNLTSIEIPAGVTSIGSCAFEFCSNLESVTFAEGSQLASIGRYAFRDCSSLKSIEIPAGVTSIGDYAFWCCSNLNTVYYAGSIENWFDIEFSGALSNPLSYGADLYIDGALLTKVEVPESITTIGYQLTGCTSLTSITIHSGVTIIGDDAFNGCSNLTVVGFAEGSQLTGIGYYAFYECSNLNKVYYAGSIEDWFNIEFGGSYTNPLYYGADLYIGGELVTEVVVPESVTTIEEQLRGCTSLTSITIHFGVTSIGSYAFSGCSNLESVSFAEGSQLTSIGDSAFSTCSSLTSIEIPAGVTSIGNSAFWGCYLTIVYNYSDLEITAGSSDYGDVAYYAEVVLTHIMPKWC